MPEPVCNGDKAIEHEATLSETKPKVTLQCATAQATVVPDLAKGWVCPISDLAKCATPTGQPEADSKPVSLSVLMGGAQDLPVD